MGEVIAHLAMSLDGFIADPDDGCDELFGFYQSGDVAVKLSEGFPELHVSQTTADLLTRSVAKAGATVVGRRLYDLTNGWDGHPGGEVPMVVVTHHPPQDWPRGGAPIFFETSVEAAVAKARAGRREGRRHRRRHDHPRLPGRRAAGRDPGQPGAGDPRRGDPVAGRHPRAGAPLRSRGGRGPWRHPPALRRPQVECRTCSGKPARARRDPVGEVADALPGPVVAALRPSAGAATPVIRSMHRKDG